MNSVCTRETPLTCEPQTTVSCWGHWRCWCVARTAAWTVAGIYRQKKNKQKNKKHISVSRFRVYILYWTYFMERFLEHHCVFSALNSTTLTLPYPNHGNHIIHSSDKPHYNVTQNLPLILHSSTFFFLPFFFLFFEITSYVVGRVGWGVLVGRGREVWFV